MWQRSGLAARWARASAAGGPAGAVADRDLDAVVALFDAAAGFVDRLPLGRRPAPSSPTCPPRSCPGDTAPPGRRRGRRCGCSPRTPPRAWSGTSSASPACRRASGPTCASATSLLGAEDLVERRRRHRRHERRPADAALAEERRLFYVACTRARRRLVVTAVEGALDGADAGATASRFLDLVGPAARGRPAAHRAAPLADAAGAGGRPAPRAHRSARPRRDRRSAAAARAAPAGRRGRARRRTRPAGGGSRRCRTTPRWCPRRSRSACGRRRSRPSSGARCGGC